MGPGRQADENTASEQGTEPTHLMIGFVISFKLWGSMKENILLYDLYVDWVSISTTRDWARRTQEDR